MCARLVTALEELANREAATLEARDFPAAIAIQDRAAPLVELISAHAAEVTDPALRKRIAVLLEKRNRTGEWIAEQVQRVREELQQVQAARQRVTQIAPYRRPAEKADRRQLCAVG